MSNQAIINIMNSWPWVLTHEILGIINRSLVEYYEPDALSVDITDSQVVQIINSKLIEKEVENIKKYDLSYKDYLGHKLGIKDTTS